MSKDKSNLIIKIVKAIDVVMITLPFAFVWFYYYAEGIASPYYNKGNWAVLAVYVILYFIFGKVYDAFLISYNRISEIVYSQFLASGISDLIIYMVICLLSKRLCNLLPGIGCVLVQLLMATIWAYVSHKWYFKTFSTKPTIIVYGDREGMDSLINDSDLSAKFHVEKNISVEECLNDLSVLDNIQTVFLSGIHSHERNIILKHCIDHDVQVFLIPRIGDVIMSGARKMHLFHLPVLTVGRYMASPEYLIVKRMLDIIVSLLLLILVSPILLITSICIKVEDGGPIFYKQTRLTIDGKEFDIIKFRSMKVNAESDGVARLSTGSSDDRITKVGKFIRMCRIDELPQLINILFGDLSIVGPRPERPEIAKQYCETMPEFNLRLQCKAGLTGYAQVYGKYNTTPYDKLQMDLMYISNPSLIEDLKIFFATVKIIFIPDSTEGIEEGRTNALNVSGGGRHLLQKQEELISNHLVWRYSL